MELKLKGFGQRLERGGTEKVFLLFLFFEVRLEYSEGKVWVENF